MGILNVDEFLGRHPEPKQCDTKSPSGQCPDQAFYLVGRENQNPAYYCQRCVTAVLFYGTNNGKSVTVARIPRD